MTTTLSLSDRALQPGESDLLGRGVFVRNLATILCNAPKGDSVVFALYGKWGEGKTSTLTLLDKEFATRRENKESVPVVIRFNPWVFSGRERLFAAFFEDIGNAIGASGVSGAEEKAKKWKRLGAYSNLLGQGLNNVDTVLNVFGASVPGWKLLGKFLGSVGDAAEQAAAAEDAAPNQNLAKIRGELEVALAEMPLPLLVVLDDLDRLPPVELVEIFQLLKSAVDLPNVHYLLLCDRGNIERNLKKQGLRADYLEKIVQFGVPLPTIPDAVLHNLLISQIKSIFQEFAAKDPRISEEIWTNDLWDNFKTSAFSEVFETLRDVKRFVGEFRMMLPVFCNAGYFELNPEHFLKFQALRLFCPSVVELIRSRRSLFTKKILGLVNLGDETKQNDEQKSDLIEKEIPELLSRSKMIRYLPLVRELLLLNGVVISENDMATEGRYFTSRLWFNSYFTIEMPEEYVSVEAVAEIRRRLRGTQESLTEYIGQIMRGSGDVALARCLYNQFQNDIHNHGQAIICAILSIKPSDRSTASDGPWFHFRDYFSRWLSLTPDQERQEKMLEILHNSSNYIYFSSLLYNAKDANENSYPLMKHVKSMEDVLGVATAKIIESKAESGLSLPQFGFWHAQDAWLEWGSKKKLVSWIKRVTATESGLKDYLFSLGGFRETTEGNNTKLYFWINPDRLATFPDIKMGTRRCNQLHSSSQNLEESLMLESAVLAFKAQSEYRKGYLFFKKMHPDFLKARFHEIKPKHVSHYTMSIITAENPGGEIQSPEENKRLTERMANDLNSMGMSPIKLAVGAANGSHLEQSFLIATNLETAVEIGKKYNQIAIFMIYDMDRVVIVSCDGQAKHVLGTLRKIVV